MDLPPRGSVGRSGSQVDPWGLLIDGICEDLTDDEIDRVFRNMFGFVDDDEGVEMEPEGGDQDCGSVKRKFQLKMMKATAIDVTAKNLQTVFDELNYYKGEEGVKMSQLVDDFLTEFYPPITTNTIFVGRQKEVDEIRKELKRGTDIKFVTIHGIGGQGKTTLAEHICSEINCVIYRADMRDKTSASDMIKALLREAHFATQSDEKLMEEFKQRLLKQEVSTLFFVDDCDQLVMQDQYKFYQMLREILSVLLVNNEVRFLFTTRVKFDTKKIGDKQYIYQCEIDSLLKTDAIDLLRGSADKDIAQLQAEEIVAECACSPLAITTVASLIREEKFTVERLLFHLKMDKKNVTKEIKIDICIKTTIDYLADDERRVLVCLAVFEAYSFDREMASKVCPESSEKIIQILQKLCNAHLVDRQSNFKKDTARSNNEIFSLHPLVNKYLHECCKSKSMKEVFNEATKNFIDLYEKKISEIVFKMDKNCTKAMKMLELHKSHILKYYSLFETKKALLEPYPKQSRQRDFLRKKRISDLTDLILPDVQKRRLFKSEAQRAKDSSNDAMYIFWTVEEADVYMMLCDKPSVAMELLDKLSNGKYPALHGLHPDHFFPHLVHSMFHKVKGLTLWKQLQHEQGLQHLSLSLKFLHHFRDNTNYQNYRAKVRSYMGQIYIDQERFDEALESMNKGYGLIIELMVGNDGTQLDIPQLDIPQLDIPQLDIPRYLGYFGLIYCKKGQREQDPKLMRELLDKALENLNKGMDLDRKLKLDSLDGYAMKRKVKADVLISRRKYDEALKEAEAALDQRRAIIQPPHFKYAESVHQVAKIYLLKGKELRDNGNLDLAMKYWRTSSDYFKEMEEHHLVNGSISTNHPLYYEIRQDHFEVRRLHDGEGSEEMKQLIEFYTKLESGHYQARAESHLKSFLSMTQTVKEFIQQAFGSGGKEFGDREVHMQRQEEDAAHQIEQMLDGRYGVDRHDSGHESTSSDLTSSTERSFEGSTAGSGSLSNRFEGLRLEKSISYEDEVFQTNERNPLKRQKTINEKQK